MGDIVTEEHRDQAYAIGRNSAFEEEQTHKISKIKIRQNIDRKLW